MATKFWGHLPLAIPQETKQFPRIFLILVMSPRVLGVKKWVKSRFFDTFMGRSP